MNKNGEDRTEDTSEPEHQDTITDKETDGDNDYQKEAVKRVTAKQAQMNRE